MPSSTRLNIAAAAALALMSSCTGSLRASGRVSTRGSQQDTSAGGGAVLRLPSVGGGVSSSADTALADARSASGGAKVAEWQTSFNSGDCTSQNVAVTIRPDGTGNLESLSQVSSARVANWSWAITGLDSREAPIWALQFHRGPRMDGSQSRAAYTNDFTFNYDSTKFERTAQIRLIGVC